MVIPDSILTSLLEEEILGLTIIGESRSEPVESQIGVACVIRNRLHSNPTKYKSYSEVCLEEKQFSCWNTNDVNYNFLLGLAKRLVIHQILSDPYIRQCFWVASGVISWAVLDNTRGAIHYMTKNLFDGSECPKWAKNVKTQIHLGSQVYFNI